MAFNPAGFVPVFDNTNPDAIAVLLEAQISGGQFVYAGSKAVAVSSGVNSFISSDILGGGAASGTNNPIGVAMGNAGSNEYVTVLRKGDIICTAAGAFAPTERLQVASNDAVTALGSAANPIVVMNRKVGYALTGAGSEGYAVVRLDL